MIKGAPQRMISVAIVVAALVVSSLVHQAAADTFPPPWSDEASFLWPARSFALDNTLLTPQLNPDRHVFWMPPGYMLVVGLAFKVTGASLKAARWLSWLFAAMSFVALAVFLGRYPLPLLSISLLSLFFLSGVVVAVGNIARMETLVLLVAVTTFCLLQAEQRWQALAIAALGPLIHPNGGYFALGAVVWLLYDRGLRWGAPSIVGWTAISAGALAWAVYAAYVLPNWSVFRSDMAWQFANQMTQSPVAALASTEAAIPIAWFVVLGAIATFTKRPLVLPITFGGCCFLVKRFRREMWYQIFDDLALLILGLATIWIVMILLGPRKRLMIVSVAVLLVSLLGFLYRRGVIEGPRGYPRDMQWAGAVMPTPGVPYLTPDDVERVTVEVARHLSGTGITRVNFYPFGDSLFFADAWGPNVTPFRPRFSDVRPDILVARTSRYMPSWQIDRSERAFAAVPDDLAPFHQRSGTERWYVVNLRGR